MRKNHAQFSIRVYAFLPTTLEIQVDAIDKESFAWVNALTPKEFAVHKDKFCSHKDRIGCIVVLEKNDVIGAATLLRRVVKFDGVSLILGGIGGVCTRQDKRKNGVGTLLVKKAMEELRRAGSDIAYLCTDVTKEWMVGFYEKVGFVRLKYGHIYIGKSATRYTEFDGMIAPICSADFFQRIMKSEKVLNIGRGNW